MKDVEMEGRNIKAVYIRSDPSRRAVCDQLDGVPMPGLGRKASQVFSIMYMVPIRNHYI